MQQAQMVCSRNRPIFFVRFIRPSDSHRSVEVQSLRQMLKHIIDISIDVVFLHQFCDL